MADMNAEVWNEEDLCKLMGVKPIALQNMRLNHGLPHVKVGRGKRVYLTDSVLKWLQSQEKASTADE